METVKNALSWILRIVVALLFIYAGGLKILNPDEFYRDIQNYQTVPDFCAYLAAYFLPPFEILLGLGLLSKSFFKESLFGISALLLIFIIALASTIMRGLDISCGCFGGSAPSTALSAMLKDVLMLIALAIVAWVNCGENKVNIYKT